MRWGHYSSDPIPFPTPNRNRDIYYPNYYNSRRDSRRWGRSSRDETRWENSLEALRDKKVENRAGDLGWTLGYATAWLYRHLVHNRTDVANTIDQIRKLDKLSEATPYYIFEPLNRSLFGGKLRGMVYLRWKSMAGNAPGTTSAPGVAPGVSRICIELNRTPFDDDEGDIDDLLDAQIHQLIHAWFLVACGAQPKHATPDDRLLDGIHFGVILHTIKDIARDGRQGLLDLVFYAAHRGRDGSSMSARQSLMNRGSRFIAVNPRGSTVDHKETDGQSHCCLDNRSVRMAQLKNWQVDFYSVEIDLGMDGKGDQIHDLDAGNELVPVERIKGPPSSTYIELIWDDKRVMVKREHSHKYASIKKPLEKNNKMELSIPKCSLFVFRHIYDFFNKGRYQDQWGIRDDVADRRSRNGPPVWAGPRQRTSRDLNSATDIVVHLETFKVAEGMKFEELQAYVLKVLWDMPVTDSDPIEALKVLYNENDNSGPIHAELHKWARDFLARTESNNYADQRHPYDYRDRYGYNAFHRGASNYETIKEYYHDRFQELYYRNMALRDDCHIVTIGLDHNSDPRRKHEARLLPNTWTPLQLPGGISRTKETALIERGQDTLFFPRTIRPSRSWSTPHTIMSPASSTTSLASLDTLLTSRAAWDGLSLGPRVHGQTRPLGLNERSHRWALPPIESGRGSRFGLFGQDRRSRLDDLFARDRYPYRGSRHAYERGIYGY